MGKYENIFNVKGISEAILSPQEAVAAISIVTYSADIDIEDVDAELLVDILWGFDIFEEYSDEEFLETLDRLILIAEEEGLGVLFNTARENLTDNLLLDAFAAGVSVLVDEEKLRIPSAKTPLVSQLQQALQVEDEAAKEMIAEVIAAFEQVDSDDWREENDRHGQIKIELEIEVYSSPSGNFTVPLPIDFLGDITLQSQEGLVSFADHEGNLLQIDYYLFSSQELEKMIAVGQEEYLKSILINKYIPAEIVANLSDAQVKYSEYLTDVLEGSYFTLVEMPLGATITNTGNNGNASKLDAYRGLISFINEDFLYIVSSQRSFFENEKYDNLQVEIQDFKEDILDFIDTIEFT